MKMISFAVKKGGVGKTTICKNIAYKLAKDNKKVLVIDLDPQATLTLNFSKPDYNKNKTLKMILTEPTMIFLSQIIQKTKYQNINIIVAGENLNKTSSLINLNYPNEKEQLLLAEVIYKNNQSTFDSYDYVLIDYPPTMQELALSFLSISDLIVVPLTDDGGCYKGLIDLKNTINMACHILNKDVPPIKILLNNIKNNDVSATIFKWLQDDSLENLLLKTQIKHSDTFAKNSVTLDTIWTNASYWRQKQAYEELINEIL